ncbi:MAG TPA: MFS transporter [Casimicrobiaceae bacterium]|nr:MFS transporter [Casimicrobiaceae bacterium]
MPDESLTPVTPSLATAAPQRSVEQAFRVVFPGVMVAMFLAAADQTILASALPAIASTLHGVTDLSWVVIAYLLAATVAAPVYGHLGDAFGRKRLLMIALSIFTMASIACALAPSLGALIAARALQGLGGGGLMTMAQSIIGENVPPRERGRFSAYFAMLFAASSTAGPVLGAYLTESLSWRAVFAINLPLGIIAWWLARRIPVWHERREQRFRSDPVGTIVFAASALTLLFALSSGGHRFAWNSPALFALLALALSGFVALVYWERRREDPVIPVRLLEQPAILRSDIVVFFFAASLFSTILYLPIYLQLGRGVAIGESGLLLLPITLSMVTCSAFTGRHIARTGEVVHFPVRGLFATMCAMIVLALFLPRLPTVAVLVLTMVTGAGLGAVMAPTQVIVQHAAGRHALGSATASIAIARAIGGAVGVAIVGAALFVLAGRESAGATTSLNAALEGGASYIAHLAPAERNALSAQLDHAFRLVFGLIATMAAIGALAALRVPKPSL